MTNPAHPDTAGLRAALVALAENWDTAAQRMGERALIGDPAAVMASVSSLESCAAALRAALAATEAAPLDVERLARYQPGLNVLGTVVMEKDPDGSWLRRDTVIAVLRAGMSGRGTQ